MRILKNGNKQKKKWTEKVKDHACKPMEIFLAFLNRKFFWDFVSHKELVSFLGRRLTNPKSYIYNQICTDLFNISSCSTK